MIFSALPLNKTLESSKYGRIISLWSCFVFFYYCIFKVVEDLKNFRKTYGIYRLLQGFRAG